MGKHTDLGLAPFDASDYLDNEEIGHRYYSTLSLIRRLPRDPDLLPVLRQRLDTEQETLILELLQDTFET